MIECASRKEVTNFLPFDFSKKKQKTLLLLFFSDRAPFVFTKQMLYAMSEGGTSKDAMHRFVDLCSQAFETLRQSSLSILILLSHLCSSNIPNLTTDAIRFVYDRLSPTLNYAQSVTRFTDLIVDSLNSTWTVLNGFIHKVAVNGISSSANNSPTSNPSLNIFLNKVVRPTNEKILSIRLVQCEKRLHPQKYYLYRFQIRRNQRTTFHYRTYAEFFDFYERLKIEFPLIGLNLKYSRRIEDKVLAQRRSSDINAFLNHLFELANEIFQVNRQKKNQYTLLNLTQIFGTNTLKSRLENIFRSDEIQHRFLIDNFSLSLSLSRQE